MLTAYPSPATIIPAFVVSKAGSRQYLPNVSKASFVAESQEAGCSHTDESTDRARESDANRTPILGFKEFTAQFPTLRLPIIDGILREGEVMNIIASAKTGKSFLVHGMAIHVAVGRAWLSHAVRRGRVLIIDNELHPETLTDRLRMIAKKLEASENDLDGQLDFVCLRGKNVDIKQLRERIQAFEAGHYKLIIIDALYRAIPKGTSENDNAQMMEIYNYLDQHANKWNCGIAVIHHSSKGEQSSKAVTDVGAGAGAISRAADTHLTIRPHEEDSLGVLEAVTRSFKRPNPVSIAWNYPLWTSSDVPPVHRNPRKAQQDRDRTAKDLNDQRDMKRLLALIPEKGKIQQNELLAGFGGGADRMRRLATNLGNDGKINFEKPKKGDSRSKGVFYSRTIQTGARKPKPVSKKSAPVQEAKANRPTGGQRRKPAKDTLPMHGRVSGKSAATATQVQTRRPATGTRRVSKPAEKANSDSDSTRKPGISKRNP